MALYGGVRSTIDYAIKDGRAATRFVTDCPVAYECRQRTWLGPKSDWALQASGRLLDRVASASVSPDDAAHEAMRILVESALIPQLLRDPLGTLHPTFTQSTEVFHRSAA